MVKAMLETGIRRISLWSMAAKAGTGAAPLEFTDHVGRHCARPPCWCTTPWWA